jgi:hypothetical protein
MREKCIRIGEERKNKVKRKATGRRRRRKRRRRKINLCLKENLRNPRSDNLKYSEPFRVRE